MKLRNESLEVGQRRKLRLREGLLSSKFEVQSTHYDNHSDSTDDKDDGHDYQTEEGSREGEEERDAKIET